MAKRADISARRKVRRISQRHNCSLFPLVLASCLAAVSISRASGPAPEWVKIVGTPDPTRGMFCYAVATDSHDNIYVGSGPNIGLMKFDPSGNQLWRFGLQLNDGGGVLNVRGIAIDESDNIYFAGDVWGTVRVGAFNYYATDASMFFAKMTPNGSNVFAKFFSHLYTENRPLCRATNGLFFVGGSFNNAVTYEGITLSPTDYSDVAVFKLNPDGSPIWGRRGTGNLDDYLDGLASTDSGDIIAAGTFNSASFGMGGAVATASSSKTLYLLQMDAQGTGRWARAVSSAMDPGNFITVASAVAYSRRSDAIIWAGDFQGTFNLVSPPFSSLASKDVFVAKLSSAGSTLWARRLGGASDQFARAVAVDDAGNIYVAGSFFGQITVGTNTFTSLGLEDIFVAKFNDDGTVLWAKQIGSTARDRGVSLAFTKTGQLLVAGTVGGGAWVDGVYVEGAGPTDGFLAKFRFEGLLPRFLTHPQSRVVSAGMTINLTAEVNSDSPVTYQWWFNGSPLGGETNSTLTIANVQPARAGSYYLVAKNVAGETQSDPALLSYTDASTLTLSIHPSLTIFGTPGRTYRIEYASETRGVAQWIIATNLTLTSSPQLWIDPTAAVGQKRFYRVLLQ